MKIDDILRRCTEIKRERRPVYSNYYNKYTGRDVEFDVIEGEGTIVFGIQEEFIYRIYFCSNNLVALKDCLEKVPKNSVTDWVCKGEIGEIGDIIEESKWKRYAEYIRNTVPVKKKMKKTRKKTRLELLLEEKYDPECAEPAEESDIPAIRKLMIDTFDPVNSEILTEEELRKLIQQKTVWIYKVEGKICTLYIYRIEGKKRYGAMTYNCLSADYLYNVTRKANDISNKIHKPIAHYGWIDVNNKKIKRTLEKTDSLQWDGVKNHIFQKL